MTEFLLSGPEDAQAALLFAHGAGAPMDSPFMNQIAELLAARYIQVIRFEFPYMASRRLTGKRKPAVKAELLMPAYLEAVATVRKTFTGKLAIGGKSLGGRVASMIADQALDTGQVQGLVCLGYPFHPPGTPDALRTAHLEILRCPALIVQGERDPFGSRAEVEAMRLSPAIAIVWSNDGDHDLGPRGASGFTRKGNLAAAADEVAAFMDRI